MNIKYGPSRYLYDIIICMMHNKIKYIYYSKWHHDAWIPWIHLICILFWNLIFIILCKSCLNDHQIIIMMIIIHISVARGIAWRMCRRYRISMGIKTPLSSKFVCLILDPVFTRRSLNFFFCFEARCGRLAQKAFVDRRDWETAHNCTKPFDR